MDFQWTFYYSIIVLQTLVDFQWKSSGLHWTFYYLNTVLQIPVNSTGKALESVGHRKDLIYSAVLGRSPHALYPRIQSATPYVLATQKRSDYYEYPVLVRCPMALSLIA